VRKDFLQATAISAFSLVEVARAFQAAFKCRGFGGLHWDFFDDVTAENYGYMAPIKAALETSSYNLAKSFSQDSCVRFNTVNAGPLKTSASAGIPGYLESYLYAEKLTFRKKSLSTREVANTALFLLSPASSGINGQGIVVNAGMDRNYFDQEVVQTGDAPRVERARKSKRISMMKFNTVAIESIAYALPDEVWSSLKIERCLQDLYQRLGLREGRLELMTGIRERRFWSQPMSASGASTLAGTSGAGKSHSFQDKRSTY
jgi:hypothetical protein